MKRQLVFLLVALTTPLLGWAQNYYTNDFVIQQDNRPVFRCTTTPHTISLTYCPQYARSEKPQENNVAGLKDRSVFKKALEATFTPEELERYKDMMFSLGVIHDADLRPVDLWFSFDKELGQTIPPDKFVALRQKILQLIEFTPVFPLDRGKYYTWEEGFIAPLWYYRDAKYIQRGRKR